MTTTIRSGILQDQHPGRRTMIKNRLIAIGTSAVLLAALLAPAADAAIRYVRW